MTQPKILYQRRDLCSDSLWGAGDQMNSCGVLYWSSVWEYTWTTAIIPLLPAENDHLSFLDDVVYIKSKFSGKSMFARPVDQTVQGHKEHWEWCVSRYIRMTSYCMCKYFFNAFLALEWFPLHVVLSHDVYFWTKA